MKFQKTPLPSFSLNRARASRIIVPRIVWRHKLADPDTPRLEFPSAQRVASAWAVVAAARVAASQRGTLSELARDTVQARGASVEPLRQIPGLKKPVRTWQDEVRERVARRKGEREEMRAPALAQQPELSREELEAAVASLDQLEGNPAVDRAPPETRVASPAEPSVVSAPVEEPDVILAEPPSEAASGDHDDLEALDQLVGSMPIDEQRPPHDSIAENESGSAAEAGGDEELSGLDQLSFRTPTRSFEPPLDEPPHEPPVRQLAPSSPPALGEDDIPSETESPTWSFDLEPPQRHSAPVERPAFVLERAEAVAVDLLILGAMSGTVAYFAARVAQVPPVGLISGASYILAFLVGIGLLYATCFTGATGQTPGKMLVGLRVVDTRGNPPGAGRALLRSILALLGLAFLGLGAVPIFLDPARRAAHDRLVGTRVIRR